ncbi:MAG: hypothetical protein WBI63_01695 [Coriobacteriia bacterium]
MLEKYIGYGYLVLVALGYAYTYAKSREKAKAAAINSAKSFRGVIVTFVAVFGLVGLLDVFVPPSLIERLLGANGGVVSIPFEARIFGTRFAITRNALSFAFAMVIGLLMGWML